MMDDYIKDKKDFYDCVAYGDEIYKKLVILFNKTSDHKTVDKKCKYVHEVPIHTFMIDKVNTGADDSDGHWNWDSDSDSLSE